MSILLYHGSYVEVTRPNISFSRNNLDFGRGFYVTPIREQAFNWAERFKRKHGKAVVSHYTINNMSEWNTGCVIKTFETYSQEWLEFVINCRSGKDNSNFDVVIGGIANDRVFDTIQLYLDGLIDQSAALQRLQYDKPNLQYCFRNQKIIEDCLLFLKSEVF